MKPSRGTVIPSAMRKRVMERDRGCVGVGLFPGECGGGLELDHVRASHAMGMKSETTDANLVVLCGAHHRWKTEHGKEARFVLKYYVAGAMS